MSTASERTIQVLAHVVKDVHIGTNLGLVRLLWALVSGSFLGSRGAIFPALQACGFSPEEMRHSWQALWAGQWRIADLLAAWREYVLTQTAWQPHEYAGYRPLAVDITAFWRPRLRGWAGGFFQRLANRQMKGVGFGIVAQVGQIGGQRIALLKRILRPRSAQTSEAAFKKEILRAVSGQMGEQEVLVHDSGVSLPAVQQAGIRRFVLRLPTNCTARRNYLNSQGQGRPPEYGERVRPLPRTRQGRQIAATAPDEESRFVYAGRTIRVQRWRDLVRPDQKVSADNETFSILVFFDPMYPDKPLVVATNLPAPPQTIFALYLDRWPVEQIPLAAKQMLGLHRHFVSAVVCCWRLPALALLAGNILTVLAAVLPPLATGFWDQRPQRTPGRLRRVLAQADFPALDRVAPRLRKKRAVSAHLPKGIDAHRRQKLA